MSAPYSTGNACESKVFTANNAGVQLGVCGPNAAQAAAATVVEGALHTITVSADTTANVISVYDSVGATGAVAANLIAQVTTSTTTVPQTFTFDVQAELGLWLIISGVAGTGGITVSYR